MMKKLLFAYLIVLAAIAGYKMLYGRLHLQPEAAVPSAQAPSETPAAVEAPQPQESLGDRAGKQALNAALSVAPLDVSMLSETTEKLKGACARNKFGLSEQDCIQALETRKELCIQQTASRHPGQMTDANQMQQVVASYVNCIFQR